MPCWTQNTMSYEKLSPRPDLLSAALDSFTKEMEPRHGKVAITVEGGIIRINIAGRVMYLNMAEKELSFSANLKPYADALKRHYSTAVVRHVAGKSVMKQKFNVRVKDGEFVLTRKR